VNASGNPVEPPERKVLVQSSDQMNHVTLYGLLQHENKPLDLLSLTKVLKKHSQVSQKPYKD